MKKLELKTRKLLRTIFGGISLTAVAFIFQACYGPPIVPHSIAVSGTVQSKTTSLPIKGIKVSCYDDPSYVITNEDGYFSFQTYDDYRGEIPVKFADIDSTENGGYFSDTTIIVGTASKINIFVELEEKEF